MAALDAAFVSRASSTLWHATPIDRRSTSRRTRARRASIRPTIVALSARSSTLPHRSSTRCDRPCACRAARMGRARRRRPRRCARPRSGSPRSCARRIRRAARARSGQDPRRRHRRSARGGRFLPLLRGARARAFRRPIVAALADRRVQRARAARSRRVRLHQSRGIFRWRSTSDRSPRRSPQATLSSPSPPSRRR